MSWKGLALAGFLLGTIGMTASMRATTAGPEGAPVTFNKDVLPILQKNCQTCHRPGEIAPMSFLTYKDARPWAKAMKTAVVSRQMPPWFADPNYGHFSNDKRISDAEIQTIAAWADGVAVAGLRQLHGQDLGGDERAQHLGGAPADREHPDVAGHALQRQVARIAPRAEHLERVVDDADGRLRREDL